MTTTPSNSTPPFRIAGEGEYRTEGGYIVDVRKRNVPGSQFCWEYNHPGELDSLYSVRDDGSQYFDRGLSGPYNIVSRCYDAPSVPVLPLTSDARKRKCCATPLVGGEGVCANCGTDFAFPVPTPPDRLARARAALEEARTRHRAADAVWETTFAAHNAAEEELAAAEKEAEVVQARVVIPAPVLGVVREILGEPIANGPLVVRMIARHYGTTEEAFRARLESEKT